MMKHFYALITVIFVTLFASNSATALGGGGGGDSKKVPAGPVELYNAIDAAAIEFHERFANDETCSRNLDVPILVLPVTRYEQLAGYSFMVPRVCLKRGNQYDYLSQIHFITDAMTRAAHRAPILLQDDGSLNHSATSEEILGAISEYVNPTNIDRLDLIERDLRLLR